MSVIPKDNSLSKSHCRILFLRSHGNPIASSVVAHGLQASQSIEFFQYPPWPDEFRPLLKKLGNSEEHWNTLHCNVIPTFRELSAQLSRKEFDLILLSDYNGVLFQYAHGNIRQKLRILLNGFRAERIRTWAAFIQYYQFAFSLPFTLKKLSQFAPVIVIEMADTSYLTLENLELLRECSLYFKREIPYNRFALFTVRHFSAEGREFINREVAAASHEHAVVGSWKDKQHKLFHLIDKVQNIPLGIADTKYAELKKQRISEQDIDILFIGAMTNSMRITGVQLLQELAAHTSWSIVIKESLPFQEYCAMTARSKLTVSIAGGGWDCFRHYEAIALGSLPLINTPTIDAIWWHPMPEEIFFENTFANFTARIEQLLQDAHLRASCFTRVERQLEDHMLHSKIVEYIVKTSRDTLSRRTP